MPLLAAAEVLPQHPPVPDTFERLLLPVFTDPVHGAYGSEFHTSLLLSSKTAQTVSVYGLLPECPITCIGLDIFQMPFEITETDDHPNFYYTGAPGWFLYVPRADVDSLTANLRVYDVTRTDLNYGTEIPIVRPRQFEDGRVVLNGIPTDPRFRNTLRIYSAGATNVTVTVQGKEPVTLPLTGATDIFHPAYAVFTDFPTGESTVKVTIDVVHSPVPPPLPNEIWAFVTVTNNETQVISTITPQP